MTYSKVFACLATLVVATTIPAEARSVSRDDKAFILDWAKQNLVDPYSLRSTGISEPTQVTNANGEVITVICIEFNARNQAGGYSGVTRTSFLVQASFLSKADGFNRNGAVQGSTCYQPQVQMRSFPELGSIR